MRATTLVVLITLALVVWTPVTASPLPALIVEPPHPTSKDLVTLVVTEMDSCPPAPRVTRQGFSIRVDLGAGPCLSPPFLITHRIDVGRLLPGRYDVTVYDADTKMDARTFEVLDAGDSVVVQPAIGPTGGGTRVVIVAAMDCPPDLPCDPPSVTFGGVPATDVLMVGQNRLVVTTPAHAAGPVEVRVRRGTTNSSYAFGYYDPHEAPLPALFERVLIPVIYNGPGARGSLWQTEVTARNNHPTPIEHWRAPGQIESIPARPTSIDVGEAPRGVFLYLPRDVAELVRFGGLIRDLSRQDRDWGTELPIARERDFVTSPLELLNVPLDARYRQKLRIYALASFPVYANVLVYAMDDGRPLVERDVLLTSSDPCDAPVPCASVRPSVAELDDVLTRLRSVIPAGIRVQSNVPVWAMLTITNNDTQHVTVISPQ